MPGRQSHEIQAEIVGRFGFFPPFFEPALRTPAVLENLWQQTISSYLENPLPALFKEKLAALLARYCSVPYCIVCHSSALRPLGMQASEVLALLQQPVLSLQELREELGAVEPGPAGAWPEPGSRQERAIFYCCVSAFLDQEAELAYEKLGSMLPGELYDHLIVFLSYNRMCLAWAEAHPSLSYEADQRARDHLPGLLAAEPRLAQFFERYHGQDGSGTDRELVSLTRENRALLRQEREARRRADRILESITDAFYAVDREWRFTYLNPQAEANLRRKKEDLIGRVLWDEFPEALGSEFERAYRGAVERNTTVKFEALFAPLGGWFEVRAFPHSQGLAVYFTEITERRRAEQALRESEERFRTITESMPQLVWATDAEGNAIYGNRAWLDYTGRQRVELVGWSWLECVHPEDRERMTLVWRKALEGQTAYECEYRLRRADGEYRWMLARGLPIRNPSNEVVEWLGTTTDIEEQKRAEAISRRSGELVEQERARLYSIFEQAPLPIAVRRGPRLIFEYVNSAYIRAVGGHRRFLGRDIREAFPDAPPELIEQTRTAYLTGKSHRVAEFPLVLDWEGSGQPREKIVTLIYEPLRDSEGRVDGMISMIFDVTEMVQNRRKLESALQDLERERELRERFVASMTHDLRSPLTGARMSAQLIVRRPEEATTSGRLASRIVESLDRVDQMIQDLLDFSRIRAGEGLPLERAEMSLSELVSQVLEELITIHGDRFVSRIEPGIVGLWNAHGLRRLLENLVNNAIKYGDGLRPVTIEAMREGNCAVLSVRNEGNPLSEQECRTIFEPFKRTRTASESGKKGWGLGLPLVKGVVEAHAGAIEVTSSAGDGTVFLVRLPLGLARTRSTAA